MLPGFELRPGWLAPAEADALFAALLAETPWEDPVFRMGARVIPMPRRVAFYGPYDYAYSGAVHPACPLPPRLDEVRRRIEATTGLRFNTVLMNLYRDERDSVSWHSDDDYPHGGNPAVASLSLGATRRFRVAHRRAKESFGIDLANGDLLVMTGRSQVDYRHALPKSRLVTGARINLTYRFMAV
jgi:alkylated DNA repair dioxygenase AlkB